MKNTLIFALAVLAASGAQAQQNYVGGYVGLNVGKTELKLDIDSIGSVKDKDTAVKLYTGYRYNDNVGIEAGYVHHGEGEVDAGFRTVTGKPQSIYLAATGTVPLGSQFSLFGKLGASYNRTKASISGRGSESENKVTPLVGVGAAFAFTPAISGVVEYEHFGKLYDDNGLTLKAHAVTVGVRTAF